MPIRNRFSFPDSLHPEVTCDQNGREKDHSVQHDFLGRGNAFDKALGEPVEEPAPS